MDEILNVSNEESTVTKKKPRGKGKLYDVPIVIYASEEEASLALRQPFAGTTWLRFNSDKNVSFYKCKFGGCDTRMKMERYTDGRCAISRWTTMKQITSTKTQMKTKT